MLNQMSCSFKFLGFKKLCEKICESITEALRESIWCFIDTQLLRGTKCVIKLNIISCLFPLLLHATPQTKKSMALLEIVLYPILKISAQEITCGLQIFSYRLVSQFRHLHCQSSVSFSVLFSIYVHSILFHQ